MDPASFVIFHLLELNGSRTKCDAPSSSIMGPDEEAIVIGIAKSPDLVIYSKIISVNLESIGFVRHPTSFANSSFPETYIPICRGNNASSAAAFPCESSCSKRHAEFVSVSQISRTLKYSLTPAPSGASCVAYASIVVPLRSQGRISKRLPTPAKAALPNAKARANAAILNVFIVILLNLRFLRFHVPEHAFAHHHLRFRSAQFHLFVAFFEFI